jgi:hypothetical protein
VGECRPLLIGRDGGRQCGEDPVPPDRVGQPVGVQVVEEILFDAGQRKDDSALLQFAAQCGTRPWIAPCGQEYAVEDVEHKYTS